MTLKISLWLNAEYSLILSAGLLQAPTYKPKTLQDFTEPQEAECLFMEIRYACVCPAYSSFSSIFFFLFVCQESSQECPYIQYVSQDICATLLCCTVVLLLT